jgi:hypothetical protein
MLMRELRRVDFTIYLRALEMYFKHPAVALAPLAAGFANILLMKLGARFIGSGEIIGLLALLLDIFGLAVAVIAADYAWRSIHVRSDQAWNDARRKVSDILIASLGIFFVMFLPSLFGNFFGPLVPCLQGIAFAFVIYAIPAAAIGGTPGPAALQASVDRARANLGTTAVLCLACYGAYNVAPLIDSAVISALGESIRGGNFFLAVAIVSAFSRAFIFGYIALALAKVYSTLAYGRRFF